MSFAREFREFAVKGNVVDLAVGVIIGGAFGKIVDSLVKDIIMPVVGRIFGGLDFSNYFIMLSNAAAGLQRADDVRCADEGRRAVVRLRQLHHRGDQLHHSGVHHFPDGEADQPAEARGARRRPPAPPEEVLLLRADPRFAEALIVHARRGKPARRPFFLRSFP